MVRSVIANREYKYYKLVTVSTPSNDLTQYTSVLLGDGLIGGTGETNRVGNVVRFTYWHCKWYWRCDGNLGANNYQFLRGVVLYIPFPDEMGSTLTPKDIYATATDTAASSEALTTVTYNGEKKSWEHAFQVLHTFTRKGSRTSSSAAGNTAGEFHGSFTIRPRRKTGFQTTGTPGSDPSLFTRGLYCALIWMYGQVNFATGPTGSFHTESVAYYYDS